MATLKTRLKARMGRGEGKGLGWTGHRRVALPGEFRGWLRRAVGVRTGEVVVAQKGNVVCCDKRGGEKKIHIYAGGYCLQLGPDFPAYSCPLLVLLL